MILFSSRRLEAELARGSLTDWAKTKYLLVPFALGALLDPSQLLVQPVYGQEAPLLNILAALVGAIGSAAVVLVGIRRCFLINCAIDEDRFIERFTILVLPITVRVLLVFLPLSTTASWLIAVHREDYPLLHRHYPAISWLLCPALWYLYMFLLARSLGRLKTLVWELRGSPDETGPDSPEGRRDEGLLQDVGSA